MGSTLSALQKQLSRLPVPYTEQQEEADEYGLCRCSAALTVFTEPFVEEVKRTDGNCAATAEDEELKIELLKLYVSLCNCLFVVIIINDIKYKWQSKMTSN